MAISGMDSGSRVDPPVPATGVLVDLRNFTPSLNAAGVDDQGTNRFCFTLADFYAATLDHCMLAMAPAERAAPQMSVSSTGDGLLVVFMGPRHYANGLLAAFLLEAGLSEPCERHNAANPGLPRVSFGVGVESGEVSRIRAGTPVAGVETVIGHCVNIAARVEALTKLIASARVLVGDSTVEMCAEAFHGQTFAGLRAQERAATNDADRVALQKRMNEINRELCLTFLDMYALKGVDRPLPLYRPDESATCGGVQRFDRLLEHLVASDPDHLHQVRGILCHECDSSDALGRSRPRSRARVLDVVRRRRGVDRRDDDDDVFELHGSDAVQRLRQPVRPPVRPGRIPGDPQLGRRHAEWFPAGQRQPDPPGPGPA